MLQHHKLLQDALEQFPRWMDINKRRTSKGHLYLSSIMRQIETVQEEIDLYKQEHFLKNYIGRENEIVFKVFRIPTGEANIDSITLKNPELEITTNFNQFASQRSNISYWEEGFIYIKENHLKESKVVYKINNSVYKHEPEIVYVWNIFDEFALFSGIKRYENETNEELVKRTLKVYQNPADSTKKGIRNAIQNALTNIGSVEEEEIKINWLHEEKTDLEKDQYLKAIETLIGINHDIYRTKRWGRYLWDHPFAHIIYIPHAWGHEPELKQDGTGQRDDLKVIMTSDVDPESIQATVSYYKQSEKRVSEYIRNNIIRQPISLELLKYENALNQVNASFQIEASEVKDITEDDIYIAGYSQTSEEEEYILEEMIVGNDNEFIEEIEDQNLTEGQKYRIAFSPNGPYSDMSIRKIKLKRQDGSEIDLMTEKNVFRIMNNQLINSRVRFHGARPQQFDESINAELFQGKIRQKEIFEPLKLTKRINYMQNQPVFIKHDCEYTPIENESNMILLENSWWENHKIVSDEKDGKITFEGEFNKFKFKIEEGQCRIRTEEKESGKINEELIESGTIKEFKYENTEELKITITNVNESRLTIEDIGYARYRIDIKTEKGNINKTSFGMILPNEQENILYIELQRRTSQLPTIEFVHIGAPIGADVYQTDPFIAEEGDVLDIRSNCRVTLQRKEGSRFINETEDFTTYKKYRSLSGEQPLLIDLSRFHSINHSSEQINRMMFQGHDVHYITLRQGEAPKGKISIEGLYRELVEKRRLTDILSKEPEERILVTELSNEIFLRNQINGKETKVLMSPETIFPENPIHSIDYFEVEAPINLKISFVSEFRNHERVQRNYDRIFDFIKIVPEISRIHVANQSIIMAVPQLSEVAMTRNFLPMIREHQMMSYKIKLPKNKLVDVYFINQEGEKTSTTIGRKDLFVSLTEETLREYGYQQIKESYSEEYFLTNRMPIARQVEVGGELFPISSFIITPPENMEIVYDTKEEHENVIVENDGFKKLLHSNVKSIESIVIEGVEVPDSQYTALKQEGIIIWDTDIYIGKEANILYKYKNPTHIRYKTTQDLYRAVEYSIDAYELIGTESFLIHLRGVTEDKRKASLNQEYSSQADRIITNLSDPSYRANIISNSIEIRRLSEENKILVKSGYVYQDGIEYYHFATNNTENIERYNGLSMSNTRRIDDRIHLYRESSNLMSNSRMVAGYKGITGKMDFTKNDFLKGVSKINKIGACKSFEQWYAPNMNMELHEDDGTYIYFSPVFDGAYALIEISNYIDHKKELYVSSVCSDSINMFIGTEITADEQKLNNAPLIELNYKMKKIGENLKGEKFKPTKEKRHYIVVTGSGSVQEILLRKYDKDIEEMKKDHIKQIDKMGWNFHEPIVKKNNTISLKFEPEGSVLKQAELRENELRNAAGVSWGWTSVEFLKKEKDYFAAENMMVKQKALIAKKGGGKITTHNIFTKDRESIFKYAVRVNRVIDDKYKNPIIKLWTRRENNGRRTKIGEIEGNLLIVGTENINRFLQAEIEVEEGQVVENIEIYALYKESETATIKEYEYETGSMKTKFYDLGERINFNLEKIKGSILNSKASIQVRGYKANQTDQVFTDWKEVKTNEEGIVSPLINFVDYRFVQFKIVIEKETTIDMSDFEAVLRKEEGRNE